MPGHHLENRKPGSWELEIIKGRDLFNRHDCNSATLGYSNSMNPSFDAIPQHNRGHAARRLVLPVSSLSVPKALRIMLLPLMLLAGAAHADDIPEYQLKSDFIYNFATYVDWPDTVGRSLVLCVAAPQAVVGHFASLAGRPVGNMTISLRRLDHETSPAGCHILFVTESESDDLKARLSSLGDGRMLTVTESETRVKQGAMVGLLVEDKRVAFVVNTDAAKAAGIDINSRLLRLARKVYGKENGDAGAK
jgi:hypothetical protein